MRLFSKAEKPPKTPSSDGDRERDRDKDKDRSKNKNRDRAIPRDSASPISSRSPRKKSSSSESTRSPEKKSQHSSSSSHHSHQKPEQRSPRSSSRRFPKPSSSRRTEDPNSHPLNLPLDQLQKRLSALSAMPDAMDIDTEAPSSVPGPFETPKATASGANGTHADGDAGAPEPPPHKSNPASPVQDTPPTPEQAEAFKALGNKHYKAKEYKKAIEEYTKAVEAQPTSATYLNNRAAAYISAGQYNNALEDCIRADELDPGNDKILLRLARIYTNLGRAQEALDTYGRIQPPPSAKDTAQAKAMLQHISVAEDALKNGTTGSMALHALDQAERLLGLGAPKPRKWMLMKGEAYLKMGNVNALGDAQNLAMSLLRNNSQDPEALVLRGRALYSQGDNEKAVQHFRQAVNCDPDYRDAVKYLRMVQKLDRMKAGGNAEYKAGHYDAAIEKYTEALEVDPLNKGTNSKLLQNRALCRSQLKDYKGAIEDCERALSLDPSYTKAKKTKATALSQSGKWEDAVRELKDLQEQDPQDAGVAKQLRNAELELKKSKRKDYYKILGVDKDADEYQIKKAYRKAAIIHHPDKNPDDEDAAERFKDIAESYECLSDSQKRARYDSGEDLIDPMEAGGFGGGGMGGGGMSIDPEILMQMFGAQMGGGGRGGGGGGFQGFGGGRSAPQGFPGGFQF